MNKDNAGCINILEELKIAVTEFLVEGVTEFLVEGVTEFHKIDRP